MDFFNCPLLWMALKLKKPVALNEFEYKFQKACEIFYFYHIPTYLVITILYLCLPP